MKMDRKRSMKNSRRLFFAIIALLFLSGCQSSEKEKAFLDLYPGVDFNQEVKLTTDPYMANSEDLGTWINLIFKNQSTEVISFSLLDGTNIYTYSERSQKWVKLENQLEYNPGEDILYPKGTAQAVTDKLVIFSPKTDNLHTPIVIRMVAIGHQISDGKPVGAYYDMILLPQQ
jgi:hypothetical protein